MTECDKAFEEWLKIPVKEEPGFREIWRAGWAACERARKANGQPSQDTITRLCADVQALAADLAEARRLLAIKDAALKPFAEMERTLVQEKDAVYVPFGVKAGDIRAAARALRGEP